jgi:23S rRNA (guanosine2251-2'-O)-methyltransferase
MPWLANRDSIIERLRARPESAVRLWVEAGRERASAPIIDEARRAGVSVRVVPAEQLARRFKGIRSHVCLEVEEFAYADADGVLAQAASLERPFFAAFDGVYDPQNLGNAVRTAACFGLDAVFIPRDKACAVTDAVINVSRGGTERVGISRVANMARHIEELKKRNVFCFGLEERAEKPLCDADLTVPLCLVLGGEEGLRRLTRERCDMLLKIPTVTIFPSLNVASAFAASAYEVVRQRAAYVR